MNHLDKILIILVTILLTLVIESWFFHKEVCRNFIDDEKKGWRICTKPDSFQIVMPASWKLVE